MIYSAFKQWCLEQALGHQRLFAAMVNGDLYQPHPFDTDLLNVEQAIIGTPQRLENVSFELGALRADDIEFPAVEGQVPDYLLIFTSDGKIVCLLEDLIWHGQKIDGRKLAIRWPGLIFQL